MMAICEKAGSRDSCASCFHSKPHEYGIRGCCMGNCFPPIKNEDGAAINQNYSCVEIKEGAL